MWLLEASFQWQVPETGLAADGCVGEQHPSSLGTGMEGTCARKTTQEAPVVSEDLSKEESVMQP